MRHLAVIGFILIVVCHFRVVSQPCLPDGIWFTAQSQIDSFQINYPGCINIEGDVGFMGDDITNLSGLSVLTSIGGYFWIEYIDSLSSLTGMDNLTSIEGGLVIRYCNALTNLSGLEGLTSIGEDLWFGHNDVLITLSGLDNINAESIGDLEIGENQWLSDCAILSICNYLENPNGDIYIYGNTTGCNSTEEVQDSCVANSFAIDDLNLSDRLSIYPNPTSSEITISGVEGIIDEISIYNKLGQRVIHEEKKDNTIDVSWLPQGLYIVEVTWNEYRVREKLIVQ